MFAKDECHFSVLDNTEQMLTVSVLNQQVNKAFYYSVVYAKCTKIERRELWKDLYELNINEAWLVCGDFNTVVYSWEKAGGNRVDQNSALEFLEFMEINNLADMGYTGSTFNWFNKRYGNARIYSRLDRVLANEEFMDLGFNINNSHLNKSASDHAPILIELKSDLDYIKSASNPYGLNLWQHQIPMAAKYSSSF